jgi:hypothetical protein
MVKILVKFSGKVFAAALVALIADTASAANSAQARKYFVRRGGVVCQKKSDISKIGRSLNTLRHFKQIRASLAQGQCQRYATRNAIAKIELTEPDTPISPVQVRTEDKPNELRWMLRKDLGELEH